ncbi:tyrosine-type recombinase/integrase [Spirosoma sp. KCTC 42546]|uniref:tyrosine-type recombinase/integrase n=1 Tax=Spirosoma sp. KCTC 42546 TaxID=2520506 RepID=UPI00143D1E58|nr:tyrosine-type recombinase/integrase [Spirosoma sp. KCTC 42546]
MATYRTVFNRKNKLDKNNLGLVQIEALHLGQRRYFSTGVKIKPEQWNESKKEVKGSSQSNQRIRAKRQELEDFELTFAKLHGRPFRLADFDLLAEQITNDGQPVQTFTAYFKEQLELDMSGVEIETHQRKLRVYNRLLQYHGKSVGFADLTYSFIVGFDQALRNQHNLDVETIRKAHQILKSYVNRAMKSGLLPVYVDPYDQFRAKRKESDKIILAEQEVRNLEQLNIPAHKQHLQFYLDAWLLAYYTTLRISDLTTLRLRHLVVTEKGFQLEKKQEKTKRSLNIPLWLLHLNEIGESKALIILRRYWPDNDKPIIARSHFQLNKRFKEVLKLAGITKPITFHSARHTGITHLVKKLPVPIVQRIAGHAKIQTTMQYLHLTNQDVEQALEQVKW